MQSYQTACLHLSIKITAETSQFCTEEQVREHGHWFQDLLFSKSKLNSFSEQQANPLLTQAFFEAGVASHTLLISSFSPLAWSLTNFYHHNLEINSSYLVRNSLNITHSGRDTTCYFMEKSKSILGVQSIASIIISNCRPCHLRNQKYHLTPEGRLTENILPGVGGQFRLCYLDLAGPIHYCQWNQQRTGLRGSTSQTLYVLVAVCGVTKCVRLVPCTSQDTPAITLGLQVLMSRVGCPSIWFVDQAGAFIKIAKEGSYTSMGKEGISLESFNIHFCPVNQGHQSHSIVERTVRCMKEAICSRLFEAGAIETFNFLLICEDELNNIPLRVKRAGARGDAKTRGLFSDTITPNILCGKTIPGD